MQALLECGALHAMVYIIKTCDNKTATYDPLIQADCNSLLFHSSVAHDCYSKDSAVLANQQHVCREHAIACVSNFTLKHPASKCAFLELGGDYI